MKLTYIQGRSKPFLWYGPKKKLAPLKIFFGTFVAEIAPLALKMAPLFALFSGGGVQTVVFWSNLRPSNYVIPGRGPAGPPLATALHIYQM